MIVKLSYNKPVQNITMFRVWKFVVWLAKQTLMCFSIYFLRLFWNSRKDVLFTRNKLLWIIRKYYTLRLKWMTVSHNIVELTEMYHSINYVCRATSMTTYPRVYNFIQLLLMTKTIITTSYPGLKLTTNSKLAPTTVSICILFVSNSVQCNHQFFTTKISHRVFIQPSRTHWLLTHLNKVWKFKRIEKIMPIISAFEYLNSCVLLWPLFIQLISTPKINAL